jgi:O-acetylserine/cysteine efflux transporter
VLVKRAADVPTFPLMVWSSLIPPLPALIVSSVSDHRSLLTALHFASWPSIGAVVYLGAMATIFAYASWGRLLQRYPTAVVAPFALLAPCTGIVSSAAIFHEIFSPVRYAGMGLILCGLAVIVLPPKSMGASASGR